MRIKPLGKQLANQIAAGEVVERPASVVKELVENSIDAGANHIKIVIESGGKRLIRIEDNGCGIEKSDLSLAVSRHATSKIYSLHDLELVKSLGFRGEALASISSISHLSIQSAYKGTSNGQGWGIDTSDDSDFANYEAEVFPAAIKKGTRIEVRDLFFNTPARRKFLRTDKTEFRNIETIVKRLAIANDEISFELIHNKKAIKKVSSVKHAEDKLKRLANLISPEFCDYAMTIDLTSHDLPNIGQLSLMGWVADKRYTRAQPDQQYFYVNGRYVRDKLLSHALRQAFQTLFPVNEYVVYVLFLSIEPTQVDVNVHPTKHEVRFHHARIIHDFIVSALMQAFALLDSDQDPFSQFVAEKVSNDIILDAQPEKQLNPHLDTDFCHEKSTPTYIVEKDKAFYNEISSTNNQPLIEEFKQSPTQQLIEGNLAHPLNAELNLNNKKNDSHNTKNIKPGDITFLEEEGYLLAKINNSLCLIDILMMSKILNEEALQSTDNLIQTLLIPISIQVSLGELNLLQKWQFMFQRLGFEFSLTNKPKDKVYNVLLRKIPRTPYELDNEVVLQHSLVALEEFESMHNPSVDNELIYAKICQQLAKSINKDKLYNTSNYQFMLNTLISYSNKSLYQPAIKLFKLSEVASVLNLSFDGASHAK